MLEYSENGKKMRSVYAVLKNNLLFVYKETTVGFCLLVFILGKVPNQHNLHR